MNRKKLLALSAICIAMLGVLLPDTKDAFAVLLVQDGQPRATIMVPKNASSQVQQAAEVLQSYIQKSSGALLPIATTATGNALHVGQTPAVQKADIDVSKLDADGFILQGLDARNFAIVGNTDWGTEFGAYDFLERYLGVRWLMPTDLGEDVPQHKTIDIPAAKVTEQPVFLSRQLDPIYLEALPKRSALGQWGRYNRTRSRIAFSHNLLNLFPVSEFGQTHPTLYPMLNGKRYIPTSDQDYFWQPNLSNPETIDIAVFKIEKYFQENPQVTSFALGMNDSDTWDQSEASKAKRSGKKNFLKYEDVSDEYFAWANAVVEKVLVKYPDKWFGTLAYMNIAEPPTRVKVHPRIVPFITYDRMRWEDPKLRAIGEEITQRWLKMCTAVGFYDYSYGHNYLVPRVYPHRMQKNLSWGAQHQVKFSYAELYPNWGEGPKAWVFAKLLWNPHQDADALLSDWYTHFAGEKAAPRLKEFYGLWEKFWMVDIFKSKANHGDGELLFFSGTPKYLLDVPQSYITQSDNAMADALRLADTPQRKSRVARLNDMWTFYKASVITYQAEHQATQKDPETEAEALALLEKAENVMEQSLKRNELIAAFEKDPLFEDSAKYFAQFPATNGQVWGTAVLWQALPWAEKSLKVKTRLQELANDPKNAAREQARMVLQAATGQAKLLSINSSFEEGTKDWILWDHGKDVPAYHTADWTVSTDRVLSGKQSLKIKGLQLGAPYQLVPYQAGTFFAKVSCYVPEGSKVGTLRMVLHIMGAKGETRGGRFALPSSTTAIQPGKWCTIVLPFKLPPDDNGEAATIRLLAEMEHFEPDGEIYLDDLELFKVEN